MGTYAEDVEELDVAEPVDEPVGVALGVLVNVTPCSKRLVPWLLVGIVDGIRTTLLQIACEYCSALARSDASQADSIHVVVEDTNVGSLQRQTLSWWSQLP